MEQVNILPWVELQRRLTNIMKELPPSWQFHSGDEACTQKILRLRDIAEWTGIYRMTMYDIRSGRRSGIFTPDKQLKLSRFFALWDAGKLVKGKGPDGKWRVIHVDPAS